jgi:hypothetical protein
MKNFALIDKNTGKVDGVVTVSANDIYHDGSEVNNQLCKLLPDGIAPEVACERLRWNGNAFVDMPHRPNKYHSWDTDNWVLDRELLLKDIRAYRDAMLSSTDWTQMKDCPLEERYVLTYQIYRQALRDLPDNLTGNELDVTDVAWPELPSY